MKDYHLIHATAMFINDLDINSFNDVFQNSIYIDKYKKIYEDNINLRKFSKHHAMVNMIMSLDDIHLKFLLDYLLKYDAY